MPVFQTRNRVQILRDMVARIVARAPLRRLERSAAVYHIAAAVADEMGEAYVQLSTFRALFSIDRATGSDLDERAREIQPAVITRLTALYANGTVTYGRVGIVGLVPIPSGSIVAAANADGTLLKFRTTAAGSIANGVSTSAAIPVVALVAGAAGNVDDGTVVKMVSRIAGVTSVTNTSVFVNGRDRESDDDFRRRLKAYIRSLARGTETALETFAKVARLTDGSRIVFAKVFKDGFVNGLVRLYVDDATGALDTYDSTYIGSWDTILTALGGERRALTTERPIRDDGSWELQVNAVALVRDVDYAINTATGQVTFSTASYPTGLTAADVVRVHYRFYTRLVQEAQKIIDGDRTDRANYPGVRAAGDLVLVLPATSLPQTLVAGISVLTGYDTATVGAFAVTAVQEYINNLDIGDDVIVSELIQRIMDVEGVYDVRITSLSGTSPPANQVIQDYQVARIASSDISLV